MENSTVEAPALLSDKQTARFLGVHVSTVWGKAKSGDLPKPIRVAGRTMWRRDELEAVIREASQARDVA